jgi:D-alanine transfer protein
MIRRSLGPFILALILFFLTVIAIEPVTRIVLDRFYFKPGVVQTIGSSQTPIAFQGVILQEKALTYRDILPVYGSSEFSAESEFHPWKVFDGKTTGFVPFLVGRGGSQDLVHSLSLAAQGDTLKGKKVAVILSVQWFTPEGMKEEHLAQNFSPLQTYRILYNNTISPETKGQIVARLLDYPEVLQKYPNLYQNLLHYQAKGWGAFSPKIMYQTLGWIEMQGLFLQDAVQTAQFVPLLNEEVIARNSGVSSDPSLNSGKSLPWNTLREKAQKQGKELTTNNSFGLMNSYYNKYVLPKLDESKGSEKNARLYPSPEYEDLEILMNLLQEQEAEALFILVPLNGAWYDYTGFPIAERNAFYQRVSTRVRDNGFQIADFSGHEYDTYFLQDIMHLGWKGWVYVDEALDTFYHEGN